MYIYLYIYIYRFSGGPGDVRACVCAWVFSGSPPGGPLFDMPVQARLWLLRVQTGTTRTRSTGTTPPHPRTRRRAGSSSRPPAPPAPGLAIAQRFLTRRWISACRRPRARPLANVVQVTPAGLRAGISVTGLQQWPSESTGRAFPSTDGCRRRPIGVRLPVSVGYSSSCCNRPAHATY